MDGQVHALLAPACHCPAAACGVRQAVRGHCSLCSCPPLQPRARGAVVARPPCEALAVWDVLHAWLVKHMLCLPAVCSRENSAHRILYVRDEPYAQETLLHAAQLTSCER